MFILSKLTFKTNNWTNQETSSFSIWAAYFINKILLLTIYWQFLKYFFLLQDNLLYKNMTLLGMEVKHLPRSLCQINCQNSCQIDCHNNCQNSRVCILFVVNMWSRQWSFCYCLITIENGSKASAVIDQ